MLLYAKSNEDFNPWQKGNKNMWIAIYIKEYQWYLEIENYNLSTIELFLAGIWSWLEMQNDRVLHARVLRETILWVEYNFNFNFY